MRDRFRYHWFALTKFEQSRRDLIYTYQKLKEMRNDCAATRVVALMRYFSRGRAGSTEDRSTDERCGPLLNLFARCFFSNCLKPGSPSKSRKSPSSS
jgi:hypothetical protein